MAMPSWTHLGVGIGLTALFITGLAMATGDDDTRFFNVDGSTFRMKKLGGGRFEVAVWGNGVLFQEVPSQAPLATFTFGQDGPIHAQGNPALIDLIREKMGRAPAGLFTDPEFKRCSKPGCFTAA